jgi:anthranilate synthase component 2
VRILLIDNYDSFTFNLVHYVEELGATATVVRNDLWTAPEAIERAGDAIILSPGPCTPNEAGICLEVIRQRPAGLPLLGVCLGHQAIGQAYGATVKTAMSIMHGKTSTITHTGEGLFEGLPAQFEVARYHSLAILPETLPPMLRADAHTSDGEIMAVAHRTEPVFGLQFHPESIASEHGHDLLRAFLRRAAAAAPVAG